MHVKNSMATVHGAGVSRLQWNLVQTFEKTFRTLFGEYLDRTLNAHMV